MNYPNTIRHWIRDDTRRMQALRLASSLELDDWCLAAGFVRNLVWDRLHDKQQPTPLNDIDLVYHDPRDTDPERDRRLERQLRARSDLPWSVKNQARMHLRNHDEPYRSTSDAMSYWVETETAVGVRLSDNGELEIVAPFGVESLFAYTITMNRKRMKSDDFFQRLESKKWLSLWPKLKPSS